MNELIKDVVIWFHDKKIIENSNPLKQLEKTQEELTETRDAAVKLLCVFGNTIKSHDVDDSSKAEFESCMTEIKDGIGDTVVTLIGVCEMFQITLEECLQQAYDVISKRTGKIVNGKFVKD